MAKKTLLPYKFSSRAQKDIDKATQWYNDQRWMLGLDFVEYIEKKILHIRRYPENFMTISLNVQRAKLKKFPYTIFFTNDTQSIIILRIRHNKQLPLKRFR